MILLIDLTFQQESLSASEFISPIARIVESCRHEVEVSYFRQVTPGQISSAEAVILCGTALKDNLFAAHIDEFRWIRGCHTPVLGICAGMQVIARAFLAAVRPRTEIGMTEVRVIYQDGLFSGKVTFPAYELHNFACDLPEDFEVLAESEDCIQAFRHCSREIYGVMFHPEVRNEWVVERFLAMLPPAAR